MWLLLICFAVTLTTSLQASNIIHLGAVSIFSANDLPWRPGRSGADQDAIYYIQKKFDKLDYKLIQSLDFDELRKATCVINWELMLSMPEDVAQKCICLLWEPPTVLPHQYDLDRHKPYKVMLAMVDDLVDNQKYFKFYYPQMSLQMIEPLVPFEKKKLCTQISGDKAYTHPCELYSERRRVINYFEGIATRDFDFYGLGWQGGRNYRGSVGRKTDVLRNYKFSFCYENTKNVNGYISEKIFDCFISGCVPIYWGAENITEFIPENCFIDRRKFADTEGVYNFIKNMPKAEYENYIANIRRFLVSDLAYFFSLDYFADTLARHAVPDYQREMMFEPEEVEKLNRLDAIRPEYR